MTSQRRQPVRLITPPDRGQLIAPHRIGPIMTPATADIPAALEMAPEHAEMARQIVLFIQHHKQIIAQLEAQVVGLARAEYHADITPGGDWMLNVADGRLERSKPATVAEAPATAPEGANQETGQEGGEGAMG